MNDPKLQPAAARDELATRDARSQAATRRSYERIPYRSKAWAASSPVHLQTLARLSGLPSTPPDACRVLELGCGDGGNLIPIAAHHPGSTCVGVDLAHGHIDDARAQCKRLALDNARFEACSFVELDTALEPAETFDYVIAHGLMSWLTPHLQTELFEVTRKRLAPEGVALITYNTYPGWSGPESIRDILQQHSRGIEDVAERVERSRALLELLASASERREESYAAQIRDVLKIASNPNMVDYFAHEYLEDENHPFFVRDFVEAAGQSGLRYVADADIADMREEDMPDAAGAGELNRIERLQLQDLLTNRKFRQTLLCHVAAQPRERPDLATLAEMYVTTELAPHGPTTNAETRSELELRDEKGRAVTVDEPAVKAALLRFSEVGRHPIAFDRLIEWAWERIGGRPDEARAREDRTTLALTVNELRRAGMLTLRATAPEWAAEAGERPVASPFVRAHDDPDRPTTSLRHQPLSLENATVREVLSLCDGTRDRAALLAHFGDRLDDDGLEQILTLAARKALLVAERA